MKYLKLKYMTFLFASTLTFLIGSCGINNIENQVPKPSNEKSELQKLYEESFNGKTIFIEGDTVVNQKDIQLYKNALPVNFDALKNTNGTFKMVAIGGGITTGARDGGLYRNGQLTSYPNLVSQQMGIEFKQALFIQNEANGFGYRELASTTNGVPKYKAVSNNIALLKTSPITKLNPTEYEPLKIDNWAIPYTNFYGWGFDRFLFPQSFLDVSNPYKTRLFKETEQNPNILYQILNSKFDFVIMESGFDDFLNAMLKGIAFSTSTSGNLSSPNYTKVIGYASSNNAKAVMATIPDVTELPITKYISADDVRKLNKSEIFVRSTSDPKSEVTTVEAGSFFLPNSLSDSLKNSKIPISRKRGFSLDNPLLFEEVYTLKKIKLHQKILNEENNKIKSITKYPIVDLYSIFSKVNLNTFITDDNIRVNNQNFFSSDGIFPNAFGQAIIANEYIKVINEFYKSKIPLIPTAFYLNK